LSAPHLAIPVETVATQRRAADPAGSAWVSANAGSGKTFVLTRRVVRLLLDGVAPSRILCLTFTKAAAANMSIKVFDTLARWVTLDDTALAAAIQDTGAPRPGAAELAFARRLFARTVETPGGLKILTIHAFCEKLLHAFPFEANVAARFTVIDEIRQGELLSRAARDRARSAGPRSLRRRLRHPPA
jgi:ATP-dependent helicase/nuclease subunit A